MNHVAALKKPDFLELLEKIRWDLTNFNTGFSSIAYSERDFAGGRLPDDVQQVVNAVLAANAGFDVERSMEKALSAVKGSLQERRVVNEDSNANTVAKEIVGRITDHISAALGRSVAG